MPPKDAEGAAQDLSSIITLARKRPMNIALVMGKDGLSIAADPRKPPEVMWREARKTGGGSKGGMGVCVVEGKEIVIRFLEDGFPVTLLKAMKQRLRDEGLKYLPVFLSPDGTRMADDEGEAEAYADLPGVAAEAPARDLMAEFEALATAVATARLGTDPVSRKITGLAALFTTAVTDNMRKAETILDMLVTAVAALPPQDAASDQSRGDSLATLEAEVDALLAEFA